MRTKLWPGWPCVALREAYTAMHPHEQTAFEHATWAEKQAMHNELVRIGRITPLHLRSPQR